MESPHTTKPGLPGWRLRVSLRGLLLLTTAVFVVGYQQHQLRDLRRQVGQLKTAHDALRQEQQQLSTFVVPKAVVRPLPLMVTPGLQNEAELMFPIEVERAMMGDAIAPQERNPGRIR